MQMRRGLQVPELHLLRPEALLHLLPGRRCKCDKPCKCGSAKAAS